MEIIRMDVSDGVRQAYLWSPDGQPWAVVQVLHGMTEHMQRYARFAQYLCAQGVAVCGADQAGHGASADPEGRGYFGDGDGAQILCDDAHALREQMQARFPGSPYFMLGHSMGSFALRRYIATEAGRGLAGAMLSGTGTAPALSGVGMQWSRLTAKVLGRRHRSPFIDSLAFGGYNKHFKDREPTPHDWLTRDKAVVRAYMEDEACGFLFTASAFADMIQMIRDVNAPAWYGKVPRDLPMWLFSGDMDPVGERGKGVKAVCKRLRDAGVVDAQYTLYSGGRHEMLNELNREQVYDDMLEWLHDRT